ncbi:MAG: hypothetical protein ACR2N1_17315, partial [Rubripirellula sp.]
YDLLNDPDCLNNLIHEPEHASTIAAMQEQLVTQMRKTNDPMLEAFINRSDRGAIDQILVDTYGPPKVKAKKNPKANRNKKKK